MAKKEEEYCVLRIPLSTREAIKKIASKQTFKPRWTDTANQMLLKQIEDNKKEIKK